MIFAAPQLQEKCQQMLTHFYSTLVDLTKDFDMVNRDRRWKIMQKLVGPERFTQMAKTSASFDFEEDLDGRKYTQLHDGMIARVTDNGAVSEAFTMTNGVKQGCILAPTLFSFMFFAMLMDAYRDERPGIRIAYRTDGQPLNHWRMHFQGMDLFAAAAAAAAAACDNLGLLINTEKTVVMHQPPSEAVYVTPQLNIGGVQL
nr:unnamed protein product [Spirometra erinaceieuropaei]